MEGFEDRSPVATLAVGVANGGSVAEPRADPLEDRRDDPEAGPSREDLAVDGSEDEMWANLGVNRRDTPAE